MKFVKVHNLGTKQCGSGLRHAFRAGGSQYLAQHPSAGAESWEAALGSRTVPRVCDGRRSQWKGQIQVSGGLLLSICAVC